MKKFFLLVLLLGILGYTYRDKLAKVADSLKSGPVKRPTYICEIRNMSCSDLVRLLNSMSPGRYYESAGKLLGTSMEDMTMYRDNGAMVFVMPDQVKVIHNQGIKGPEKGYLTVLYPDNYWIKYDHKGRFVSES